MEIPKDNFNKLIQFYNDELNIYKSIAIPGIQKLLEKERTPYLKQLNALNDIYIFQNYLLDSQQSVFTKPSNHTISLYFSKVAGNLFSILQCLYFGQLISASSIERDIFETYVDTKLMLQKDTEERSMLYEEYQHAALWNRMNAYKKYIKALEISNDLSEDKKKSAIEYYEKLYKEINEKEICNNYERIKQNYHPRYPYHWAWKIFKNETKNHNNPTLDFICKKLGLYEDYLQVYSTASLAVHNQPLMANFMTREGAVTSVPIFSEIINSIASISASFVIEIILMALENGESDKVEEIKLFLNYIFKSAFID